MGKTKNKLQQNEQEGCPLEEGEQLTEAVAIPEAQHMAWHHLLRAHTRVERGIEVGLLQGQQIPLRWYHVLLTLEKAPNWRLRMSDLAENALTSPSNLSRLVDRLEAKGLLRSETDAEDRRVSYAILTEAGAQARLAAWPALAGAIRELFASHVSDEEAHIITKVMCRIADGT